MCTPCVHHEEPLSLDVIPNPISISRLFLILLDSQSFQTALDYSSLYHMTSRSRALYPLQTNKILSYLCPANPNPSQSLSTLLSYNTSLSFILFQTLHYFHLSYFLIDFRTMVSKPQYVQNLLLFHYINLCSFTVFLIKNVHNSDNLVLSYFSFLFSTYFILVFILTFIILNLDKGYDII